MRDLHVYRNESDFVIAESPEHAVILWNENTGCPEEDLDDNEFYQLNDDMPLTIESEDCPGKTTKTCAEWAKDGPGFLCSTEY